MKKIGITLFVILGLLLINLFSINGFYNNYNGKKLYENKDFSGALNYFEKNRDYIGLYNLGDSYYKLGENQKDINKRIKLWEQSLKYYLNSMKLNYTKKAEDNYDFVKKKLDELKKKQKEEQNKKQKNNKENQENKNSKENKKDSQNQNLQDKKGNKNNSGKSGENNKNQKNNSGDNTNKQDKSGNQKQSGKSQGNKSGNSGKQQGNKSGNSGKQQGNKSGNSGKQQGNKSGDNKQNKSGKQQGTSGSGKQEKDKQGNNQSGPYLSKQAQQQLKAYEQQLEQQQKQNAGEFGKVYQEQNNPLDNFDNFFSGDPFFDNSLLNRGNDKKDW